MRTEGEDRRNRHGRAAGQLLKHWAKYGIGREQVFRRPDTGTWPV